MTTHSATRLDELKRYPALRRPAVRPARAPVTVYGTRWCAASQAVRRHLDRLGVPYAYRDMELDPSAAQRIRWWTGGYFSHPAVQIGGEMLVEPTLDEVEWGLTRHKLIPWIVPAAN